MRLIHIYFRTAPSKDRFLIFDRYIFHLFKRLLKKKKISGVQKVFVNLCKGLDQLKVDYTVNLPFQKIKPNEPVVVLGVGKYALEGYNLTNPIIAGIGLMTHPAYWPELCEEYPVVRYLQHSRWTEDIYIPYYSKDRCRQWPAGIDTVHWAPTDITEKKFDFLIYNKIMWDKEATSVRLKIPILKKLDELGLSYREIVYGSYDESEYKALLNQSNAMIFLCEHESQGFASCEALSMNVPIFAWDQGYWLDPNRFKWNSPIVMASSVPFFDESCGMTFTDLEEFGKMLPIFLETVKTKGFEPRKYIMENLTLKRSAEMMLKIIDEVYAC